MTSGWPLSEHALNILLFGLTKRLNIVTQITFCHLIIFDYLGFSNLKGSHNAT
jgi:hypothetical protein